MQYGSPSKYVNAVDVANNAVPTPKSFTSQTRHSMQKSLPPTYPSTKTGPKQAWSNSGGSKAGSPTRSNVYYAGSMRDSAEGVDLDYYEYDQ